MFWIVKFEQNEITRAQFRKAHTRRTHYILSLLLCLSMLLPKHRKGKRDARIAHSSNRMCLGCECLRKAIDLGLHLLILDRMNNAYLTGLLGVPRRDIALRTTCNGIIMKSHSGRRWDAALAGSKLGPPVCKDWWWETWLCLPPRRKETQTASGASISDAVTACAWKYAAKLWPCQSLTQHSHLSY